MARVTLILPERKIFSTSIQVMVGDINYGGHLGNDRVLTIIHECRLRFIKSLGYPDEMNLAKDTALFVADSVVVYKAEAFHGDSITISLAMEDFNAYGMDIFYKLENDGREIARAKTGMVCFNYVERKVVRVPEKFLDKVKEL
jgi:4-hydroxybenzoyl-CoA thioesterase